MSEIDRNKSTTSNESTVYLDYAATTPVDPRVAHCMSQCLMMDGDFGNPASRSHVFGWQAEERVEKARTQVAQLIHADPFEIVWTSGATESDNIAIKGTAEYAEKSHIVTSSYEHKAVLDTCAYLETKGFKVTYVDPGIDGIVDPESIRKAITSDTFIVSTMHANNEIGTINDIAAIGAICESTNVLFHVDAAQSLGKIPIDVESQRISLMSMSGHKIYGPKGIGALYVRKVPPVRVAPVIHGGGHERGMRSGTLATHQIVGMGEAARICQVDMNTESLRIRNLRDRLWSHIRRIPGTHLNGSETQRLPGLLNVGFEGVDGETLLLALDGLAVASGSACTSATVEPSYVLQVIGVDDSLASTSLRFSIGRFTEECQIDQAASRVNEVVAALRARQ